MKIIKNIDKNINKEQEKCAIHGVINYCCQDFKNGRVSNCCPIHNEPHDKLICREISDLHDQLEIEKNKNVGSGMRPIDYDYNCVSHTIELLLKQ